MEFTLTHLLIAFGIGLLVGALVGWGSAIWGMESGVKNGNIFYKSKSGRWVPRDPRSGR